MGAFGSAFTRELRFWRSSFWDRALITWVPLLLMAMVAIQFSSGVMRNVPIAVVDQDDSQIARELTRRLHAAPGLHVVARLTDVGEAERLVRSNQAYAVVLIPSGAERAVMRGGTGSITTFYNASYSTTAGSALRDISAVVQAYAARLAVEAAAPVVGIDKVRAAPIAAQTTVLYNPQASYELQLVTLIHPALLHLIFMVAVVGALGRELRDGSIGAWLGTMGRGDAAAAVAGKIAPYFLVFLAWGVLATGYMAWFRGWPVRGSFALLMLGYIAMYLAYSGVALLFIGRTKSMGRALSMSGLFAGASFAFAGAVFPIEAASRFAQFWSALLPYTAFAKLLAEQWMMGSPASVSLPQIGIMLIFLLVGAGIGLPRYLATRDKPETWGAR